MVNSEIQDTIIKTHVLESDIEHLSARVERLCEELDKSLPLLAEVNLRLNDDICRRASSEAVLNSLVITVKDVSLIQEKHAEKIGEHGDDLKSLKTIALDISSTRSSIKMIVGVIGFVALSSGLYFSVDRYHDRNAIHAIELKKLELEYDEKKNKLDYTEQKYRIRKGVE